MKADMPTSTSSEKFQITGIHIKNYRSFKEFPENDEMFFPINRWTTIIGKNDIGKSNLIKAIKTILDNETIRENDFHKLKKENDIKIDINFNVPKELQELLKEDLKTDIKDMQNPDSIKMSFIFSFNNNTKRIEKEYRINSNAIKNATFKKLYNYFPKPIYISALSDVADETKFNRGTLISELLLPIIKESSEVKESTKNFNILVNELETLINNKSHKIERDLLKINKNFWKDIEDISITVENFKIEKAFTPKIRIKDKYFNNKIDIMDRGNGFQRYFILSLLEVYRKKNIGKGFVLLYEEPELYLHIGAQKRLVNTLKDFSKKGQIIITTHSPVFIDTSNIESTHIFFKENGETRVHTVESDYKFKEILDEIEAKPSDLFLSDYLLFVEGPSDVRIYKYIFDRLDDFKDKSISIIQMGGGGNVRHFLEEKGEYITNIKKINHHIAIILDGDKYKRYKDKVELFKENGIFLTFTEKEDGTIVNSLENLFSKEAIEKICKVKIPPIGKHTDVPSTIKNNNPNKQWKYNKIKHGKKIIKYMIEHNNPEVENFKVLFNKIFNFFKTE